MNDSVPNIFIANTNVDIFPFICLAVKQMRISFQQQGAGGNLSTLVMKSIQ